MDKTGVQLNNKAKFVVAPITSSEKDETITVIFCCNTEGFFVPPACIFKGKIKKADFGLALGLVTR